MKLIQLFENNYIDSKYGLDIKDFTSGDINLIRCFPNQQEIDSNPISVNIFPFDATLETTFDCITSTQFPFVFSSLSLPSTTLIIDSCSNLISLKGCPKELKNIDIHNSRITSLEYGPQICKESCSLSNLEIKSFQGIGRKYLKECKVLSLDKVNLESNILGLCLVNKLYAITIYDSLVDLIKSRPLYEAVQIVKKHLQTDGDECMEELIQAGYKNYAKF